MDYSIRDDVMRFSYYEACSNWANVSALLGGMIHTFSAEALENINTSWASAMSFEALNQSEIRTILEIQRKANLINNSRNIIAQAVLVKLNRDLNLTIDAIDKIVFLNANYTQNLDLMLKINRLLKQDSFPLAGYPNDFSSNLAVKTTRTLELTIDKALKGQDVKDQFLVEISRLRELWNNRKIPHNTMLFDNFKKLLSELNQLIAELEVVQLLDC